jgi:hypothetical protein
VFPARYEHYPSRVLKKRQDIGQCPELIAILIYVHHKLIGLINLSGL